LIAIAWELPTDRVLNAPEWTRLRKFDITAVTSPDAKQAQLPAMLKALLRDRFQLAAHLERRELPTYNLVVVRSDGRLGPALRKAPIDNCFDAAQRAAAAALTPPARPCGITFEVGHYSGTVQLGDLVGMLSSASGRPVFDRTGLTGNYEFDIRWSPLSGDTAAADAVSIFTALQEQLGLKLESSSAPLDVLVVDRVERPTAN
jgi:uncharacterized protein (TIGR03435 family)